MHELAATDGILQVALDAARNARASRIQSIDVVVGDLSSLLGETVQFYFDILSRDTLAAGAELRLHRRPATVRCRECGASYPATLPLAPGCAVCGGAALGVSGGREFYVDSIEVDQ
jgi:hydrogenase nickel incorporation protein HypA/HybF